jgi:PIN domain nuclease of toxin-antitoxin system
LRADTRALIEMEDNSIHVRVAASWEISIKHAARRGDMPISGEEAWNDCVASGFRILEISVQHAATLDWFPALHQDPFDRMLVAQA